VTSEFKCVLQIRNYPASSFMFVIYSLEALFTDIVFEALMKIYSIVINSYKELH